MNLRVIVVASAVTSLVAMSAASSLSGHYYVLPFGHPDTEHSIDGLQLGLVESTLGPNGLPVASALGLSQGDQSAGGFTDVNANNELLWWMAGQDGVTFEKTQIDSTPLNLNLYPNNAGFDGENGYSAVRWDGTFQAPAGGSVTFNLGSDDDAWVFLNGNLIMDNGGVHGVVTAPTTVTNLLDGTNTLDIFFADRHVTGSAIYFDSSVKLNPSTPAPAAMLPFALGLIARLRRRKVA